MAIIVEPHILCSIVLEVHSKIARTDRDSRLDEGPGLDHDSRRMNMGSND
jgi:hypothetical protein